MRVALGGAATGVFTNSTSLWNELYKAGVYTGDRVWRFPLWKYYSKQVTGKIYFQRLISTIFDKKKIFS